MIALMRRITRLCGRRDTADDCNACPSGQRSVCHEEIEQLVRTFVDATLRHNLVESFYMTELVPSAHRTAHNRAHLEIAEQLKAVRLAYAANGNGILAIESIEQIFAMISAHMTEFDADLEELLLAAA